MPARYPRRSLGFEFSLSLGLKMAALAAIGMLLFGPDHRTPPAGEDLRAAIVGSGR